VSHSIDSNYSSGSDEVNYRSSYEKSSSLSLSDESGPAPTTISSYHDSPSLLNQQTEPILKQQFSNSPASFMKRYVPVKKTDGPSSFTQKSMSLPTSCSSKKSPDEPEETTLQSSSFHKDTDSKSLLLATAELCSQATRKLLVLGKESLPANHQSSLGSYSKILGSADV